MHALLKSICRERTVGAIYAAMSKQRECNTLHLHFLLEMEGGTLILHKRRFFFPLIDRLQSTLIPDISFKEEEKLIREWE